jgi:hypothetical protein
MAENLSILNAAVSLLIRAVLLAARFSGRVRIANQLKLLGIFLAAGRYADFHSLRHTTGSLLAASGVHPKVAQSIMRHSDINLTMSRYSHILRGQESEVIAGLPDLSLPSRQSQQAKATGTDDSGEWTPKWTPELTRTAFSGNDRPATVGTTSGETVLRAACDKSVQNRQLGKDRPRLATADIGEKEVGRGGVEPPTHGFSVRPGCL